MTLRSIKIAIAKELKRILFAIALAALGFVTALLVGLYYENQEYPKYLQKKAEVEANVAEWKKEKLKKKQELEAKRTLALCELEFYVTKNKYLSQEYNDFRLRWGFGESFFPDDVIIFARSILRSNYYNNHIRKLGTLYHNYKNCYVISYEDIRSEELKQLMCIMSFSNYRNYYLGSYSFIRKDPPIESATLVFVIILSSYVMIRFLILTVSLIIKSIKWINTTSKLDN